MEASRAKHLAHPANRLDLDPSDFLLFGYIKEKFSDYNCESRENLLNALIEIVTGVGQEVLLGVFESRADQLKPAIEHEGEYDTM
jgi:hypothetical protein